MPLPGPNLDDRTFEQLVAEAVAVVNAQGGAWKEPALGDPGMVLLDAFAYIAEQLLYRFNKLPEKAYVELLNLIGATLSPPSASRARLTFTLSEPAATKIAIPRGTRVSAVRTAASVSEIVFATVEDERAIDVGQTSIDVLALNAELVEDELIGRGTGEGAQTFTVARPPIIAASGTSFDLSVVVEMSDGASLARADARVVDDVAYEIWHEVESFAGVRPDSPVYRCDRVAGTITFAPRIRQKVDGTLAETATFLARVPAAGKRIRATYATGGGPDGNVVAASLTTLKDQIAGSSVKVTNAEPATGGRSPETLENALLRGPREFHTLQRAVTARDFELIATNDPAVARARAYPKHELWNYAPPGTVAVLLVPEYLQEAVRTSGAVTVEGLQSVQRSDTLEHLQVTIDQLRPLGVVCEIDWVRYKSVKVHADVFVARGENAGAVRDRIVTALHTLINPLPTPSEGGWRFGRPLHVSDVTSLILAERGVVYYENVKLIVEDVPSSDVRALSADPTAAKRWYATSGTKLYRSLDDAGSWESVAAFPNERVVKVALSDEGPGLLAVVTQTPSSGDPTAAIVRLSSNAGESWETPSSLQGIQVADLAWARRDDGFTLLLATDKGLYELPNAAGAQPVQVPVFDGDAQFGFFSIAVTRVSSRVVVAVAAQAQKGIWVSSQAGVGRTFERWYDPPNADSVSVLRVQRDGPRAFLWAGFGATGDDAGKGASRIEISGASRQQSTQTWDSFDGWSGQGVRELAFANGMVFAASFSRGVVRLNTTTPAPRWQPLALGRGLPERTQQVEGAQTQKLFELVTTVAANDRIVLAGGMGGVFCSSDGGETYASASSPDFTDRVPLPPMWLFCSGQHEINVSEDRRDLR